MSTADNHPQRDEVRRLLAHLIASGFSIHEADDGESVIEQPTSEAAAAHVLGVDESHLRVRHPACVRADGITPRTLSLYVVLGNGPGELVADWTDAEPLTSCLNKWSDAEENPTHTAAIARPPSKLTP